MTHDEMIAVIAAHRDRSADIEVRPAGSGSDCWMICACPAWNFEKFEYRIKPEPRSWWLAVNNANTLGFRSQDDALCFVKCNPTLEIVHVTETPEP